MSDLNLNIADLKHFNYLKEAAKNDAFRNRALKTNKCYIPNIPPEIAIQLTYRCNLRCKSCMQWSNTGFLRKNSQIEVGDLDLELFKKILAETKSEKSRLHLWGGEPMFHKEWDTFTKLLEKDKRKVTLNTNGILIKEKIETLLKLGSNLNIVISLDGNQEENDAIRGKGTYNKVIEGLNLLKEVRNKNTFNGRILVNTVLNEKLILTLAEYVKHVECLNIDKLIVSYPWYISSYGREFMDNYWKENFSWLNTNNNRPSWHSFQFSIPDHLILNLKEQLIGIREMKLSMKLRLQPDIQPEEAIEYANCSYLDKFTKNTYCLGTYNRLSVCANGNVSACTDFPEFVVGNLYSDSLTDIWKSEKYNKIREIRNNGTWPLPICFKCSLHSANRI